MSNLAHRVAARLVSDFGGEFGGEFGGDVGRAFGRALDGDDGMSTAEYAIGTIAAAAFAATLYAVVTGDSIVTALTGIVQRALSVSF